MTDEPTVNLEEPEEIDWLREGRRLIGSGISEATLQDEEALLQASTVNGDADPNDVDRAHQQFTDAVNMTASELRDWADHECSDRASMNPKRVRQRVLGLLETQKDDWGQAEVDAANSVVSFISRMRGVEQGDGTEDCPSHRDVSLMNWGFVPDGVSVEC